MKKRILFIYILFLSFSATCKSQVGKVYFIPTLHGLHQSNQKYNYDSLKQLVSDLKPDIIAVEIRSEDIQYDSTYLSTNYPYEMRMMKYWFPKTTILGFDWLGKDIEGKLIPSNYWKNLSPIKQYERALDSDIVFSKKLEKCDTFSKERLKILKNSSLNEIMASDDSMLTKKYYSCIGEQLKGSKHERILRFYDLRNAKLLKNILSIISKNRNKTIVILTGDDHYVFLKDKFENHKIDCMPR